ncbi:MAG: 5-(carboxyamino)imidazole ribonucleotide synthase [Hyphomicrobiales bacterium]|nr:5-(carboxyamino)imidazole ribonucleotide synthase [Hyphomicrobiales bacterium]
MRSNSAVTPLPPGSVIGILGGGQLGRMLALDAARLGYRCHIFSPEPDSPASHVADRATVAEYEDEGALAAFAEAVDVVTYEFENVPFSATSFLAERVRLRPNPDVLGICQNRILEKDFLRRIGAPVCMYSRVTNPVELEKALDKIGRPAVLKSACFGYDGKGQVTIRNDTDIDQAWRLCSIDTGSNLAILEAWVDFIMEISVIVARSSAGEITTYVPAQNIHENHILKRTIVPAPLAPSVNRAAEALASRLADEIALVGILAVEMFVTTDRRLLVNELAPRPHNSGHWTIDACPTSQFEQSVRALCDLPLGETERFADAEMENLLGDEIENWLTILAEPGARLHLYGKERVKSGRKMGHVTRLKTRT